MKTAKKLLHLLVAITTVFYTLATAMLAVPFAANAAEPTSIGYNGRLFNSSGTALSGTYDFRFNLYTASSGGSATTSNIDVSDITVTSGFFTLSIPLGTDIGDLATASYLEIQVKADAASSYETMSTRVEILKSPYAVFAQAIENLAAASEPAANVSFSGRMYYDTTNNQLKVYRGGAWTTIASSMDDTYNNDTGERTVAVDDGDVSFDLSGTANFTIDTTTGTGDILFQDAGATWLTFSDGQAITAAGSGAISLSSGAASNFTTTAGDLSLVSSAASVVIRGVEGVADAILLDADNSAAGGIDMDAGTGGATLDTTGAFSIDGATASNVTVTGSAASLTLSVAGGGAQSVVLTSAGTGANAIDINATAGGFDVDAAGAATIDAAGASNFTTSTGSLTLSTSAGGTSSSVILRSVDTSSDAIYLDADGGAGSGVYLDAYDATNNTTGAITADAAYIQLNTFAATGPGSAGLDVNVSGANATLSMSTSDGAVSIDGGGSSGSVNLTSAQSDIVLDTQTASRNITIGNTAVARTINIGTGAGADVVNLGTGADQFNFVSTETTNDIVDVTFDSMTTANAFDISLDALSSGTGINIDSTAAWSGNLIKLDNTGNAIWSGNMISATTGTGAATGDLMNLAVEAGATGAQALVVTNAAVISNDLISISSTGAVTGDGIDGLSLAFATGNGADVTNAAQRISLTSGGTAGTDIAKGLLIDLTSTAGGTDTAIDIENTAAWDFDLDLQNDLTISNADNNDLSIVENSVTLNLDFAETTAATIEYSSASSLDFVSSANANDAININASAGGIDISSASGTDGEDIDITSTGTTGEIRVTTASTTADAFRLN
ncbi:hypothetical protein HZA85_00775, partial [Candidatus Uhrbacteria bacterium]|nr:hypothetical protein [Candidatus Uhrbacteria bacterium]